MNPLKPNTIEMVLIDEKDEKIQAFVKNDYVDQFLSILEEGFTITLSDFMVGQNTGTFLFAPYKWRSNFQPHTTVKTIDNFIGSLHGFSFAQFDAILNNTLANFQICDVIGYITHVGKIIPGIRNGKPNKRRILRLEDLQGQTIDCTIWDGYVDEFNSFIARESGVKHVVIIVQFGKIKKYNKACSFGTALFASKLFINSDIAEINDFRNSLKGNVGGDSGKLKVAEISTQTYFEGPESFYANCVQLTLDEIPRITKETQCAAVATIHGVCKDKPWFYIACSKCKFKVDPNTQTQVDNFWKCPTHGDDVTDVYPRYKVYVRVVDHTGSATFILFDRDVEKLITMTAYNMRGNVAEYGDDYPEELDDMAGQRAIFSFKVSRWNLKENKWDITITRLSQDEATINSFMKSLEKNVEKVVEDDPNSPIVAAGSVGNSKDAVSHTGDNASDLNVTSTAESPPGKRTFIDVEAEEPADGSSTRAKRKLIPVKQEKL